MRRRAPVIAFSSLIALVIAGVWLSGSAIARNRVPVAAPPGAFERLTTYLTRNVAETRDDHRFPELRTRVFEVGADDLVEYTRRAGEQLEWKDIGVDPRQRRVRAQIRTPLLGFVDDLEARVEAAGSGSARLQVRSSSRIGRGDFGANARHVLDLYQTVEALIAENGPGE
ncbi:MAG TPA: DUF1499 domain-containing protein [Gammaproteobacteria bacterium]|nr:DUF1499 domain-containing protein [Gammaproteobacteria bacterium]